MSAGIVLQQMVIIFMLILTGYVVYKKGIIQGEVSKGLSALVVNVCNPALLIRSAFERDPSVTYGKLLLAVFGAGVLCVLLIASSFLLPKLLKAEKKWEKHYSLMCLFGNTGFIGIPLVSAVLGSRSLIYITVINAYSTLLFYTYGIWLADGGKIRFSWKNFLNAGNLSIVVTIVLFIYQPKLPEVITSTVDYMANATTFLAMVVIGISLARTELKSIFTEKKLYLFMLLRFLALPVVIGLIMKLFIKDDVVYGVMVLMAAVPAANLTLMRVEETGGDGQLLSKGIILSTIMSLFTIPAVTLLV